MLGFLRDYQAQKDHTSKVNMITYLSDLMQDAVDYSFTAAKGAHYVLMHKLIDNSLSWRDMEGLTELRRRYAHTNGQNDRSGVRDRVKNLRPAICFKYNRGHCGKNEAHEYNNMWLRHICLYCHDVLHVIEYHTKKDCPKAAQAGQSKN